jgi:threonine dehydrogenase-like Zn-dependent dehydrogenase
LDSHANTKRITITIEGTQAEYLRIPQADGSLFKIPAGADEEAMVMLSDILPTGLESGVLNERKLDGWMGSRAVGRGVIANGDRGGGAVIVAATRGKAR